MPINLKTRITAVGPEVPDLAENGVLILFAEGAPPELAEVSVLHRLELEAGAAPMVGSPITIGTVQSAITALGSGAWKKLEEIGHVVVNFNGAAEVDRPGEICATVVDVAQLNAALATGTLITIGQN